MHGDGRNASGRFPLGPGRTAGRARENRVEIAKRNAHVMPGMAETFVAIFTLLLFFLYPRLLSGEISPILFRLTVGVIVLTLFFFSTQVRTTTRSSEAWEETTNARDINRSGRPLCGGGPRPLRLSSRADSIHDQPPRSRFVRTDPLARV